MSAIKYSPYIPNVDAWVEFYKNQPKEYKQFYTIGKAKQRGEDMNPIKLISPTESVIEQAKSSLKRKLEIEDLLQETRKKSTTKRLKKSPKVVTRSTPKKKR